MGNESSTSIRLPAFSFSPCSQPRHTRSWGPWTECFHPLAGDQETCGHWPPSDPSFSLWPTPIEWGRGGRGRAGEISAQRGWYENPREQGQGRIQSPAPLVAHRDWEFVAFHVKGALDVDTPIVPRASVSLASWTLSGKTRALSSVPQLPSGEGSAAGTPDLPLLSA